MPFGQLLARLRRRFGGPGNSEIMGRIRRLERDLKGLRRLVHRASPVTDEGSFDVKELAEYHAATSSAAYFSRHLHGKPTFANRDALLAFALDSLGRPPSFPLEFGVYSGASINVIADHIGADTRVYGFDSFEGLPEDWRGTMTKGRFAVGSLPAVRSNVELIKGWFSDTLAPFRETVLAGRTIDFIHMDCDLYSSTRTVFEEIGSLLAEDAVIVFDEFFNYPGWEHHERRAFEEFLVSSGRDFDHLACVPTHQQVAVRLKRRQSA